MSNLDAALVNHFESLGRGCEFGFLQRRAGAEPMGLLRFASMPLEGLIRGLQTQFAGIDAYVKRHGLQDASMAEARKAKRHTINMRRAGEPVLAENGEEPGELQKAEQQIQDEEDEEDALEEDYDPGSEGESEGSGTSSEEEDEYANREGQYDNLVEEELGSEAEDIEPNPEDEDQL